MNRTIFSAIFFDDETKNKIKEIAYDVFGKFFENVKIHHITLNFGNQEIFEYGKEVSFDIFAYAKDENCQAFLVNINESLPNPENKTHHITISHSNLVNPAHSNEIVKNFSFLDKKITFKGKIGKHTIKKGIMYE